MLSAVPSCQSFIDASRPVLSAAVATMSAAVSSWLERFFKLGEHGTNVSTELRAGLLSFVSCSYLLFVVPHLLASHLPQSTPTAEAAQFASRVCTGVALTCAVATALSAVLTNYPITLCPGLGIATYLSSLLRSSSPAAFAASWHHGLTCSAVAACFLLLLTCLPLHRLSRHLLPAPIKLAAMCGLGVLVALSGLRMSGLVVWGESGWELVEWSGAVTVSCFGFVLIALLLVCEVRAGMLLGVLLTALLYYLFTRHTPVWPGLELPDLHPSSSPSLLTLSFARSAAAIVSLLLLSLFDITAVIHTVAVLTPLQLHKERYVYVVSALSTLLAAFFSAPPLIVAVESVVGVKEGGRTGLCALTSACLFLLSLLVIPLFSSSLIPPAATAPLLVLIGSFLFAEVSRIDLSSPQSCIPAFVCIVLVPFTQSLAVGVVAGWLVWLALALGLRAMDGRWLAGLPDVFPFAFCCGSSEEGDYRVGNDSAVAVDEERAAHDAMLYESDLLNESLYRTKAVTTPPLYAGRRVPQQEMQRGVWEYEPIGGAEGVPAGQTASGGVVASHVAL